MYAKPLLLYLCRQVGETYIHESTLTRSRPSSLGSTVGRYYSLLPSMMLRSPWYSTRRTSRH